MSLYDDPLPERIVHCDDCGEDMHVVHHGPVEEIDAAVEIHLMMHKQITCAKRSP